MSDTPLDESLGPRWSTRAPGWLDARVERFTEEYNGLLDARLPEDAQGRFRLTSESEARRRLIDIGLWAWFTGHRPSGYGFGATEDLLCPECGIRDDAVFRLGVSDEADPDAAFDTVGCLACGEIGERARFIQSGGWSFDGEETATSDD